MTLDEFRAVFAMQTAAFIAGLFRLIEEETPSAITTLAPVAE